MAATAFRHFEWQKLRLTHAEFMRMLIAGSAWGTAMTAGITTMTFCNDGMVCLDDIAMTTAISLVAGVLAIGPIAAYGRR
jgi:hypothetical protein